MKILHVSLTIGNVANKLEWVYKVIFCLNLWSQIMLYVGNEQTKDTNLSLSSSNMLLSFVKFRI